jgi:Zn-dependent protease/CBS domain-containing protein
MRGAMRVGSLFGIPFYVHYTWVFIFALITVNLTIIYGSRSYYPDWNGFERWAMAALTSLLFFVSVLIHELSHSLVAMSKGIPVRRITLFVFGGVSEISREAERPSVEAAIAIVGPLTSLVLGGFFFMLFLTMGRAEEHVEGVTFWLGYVNLALAVFNMLPGFPMDGGRVFRATIWAVTHNYQRATRIASITGRLIGVGVMVLGSIELLITRTMAGLWLVLIGWFIQNAASIGYRQMQLREALNGVKASDVMTKDYAIAPSHLTIQMLVEHQILPGGQRTFVVLEHNVIAGLVNLRGIQRIPRERWGEATVAEAMTPTVKLVVVEPDRPAVEVLTAMTEYDVNQVPVIERGQVLGLVNRERMLKLLRLRIDLQG